MQIVKINFSPQQYIELYLLINVFKNIKSFRNNKKLYSAFIFHVFRSIQITVTIVEY